MKNGACQLYRHFDVAGKLLYVGISSSAGERQSRHEASPWFGKVRTITLQHFDTRESAAAAETAAIMNEEPEHNRAHSRRLPGRTARTICISMRPEMLKFAISRSLELNMSLSAYLQRLLEYDIRNNLIADILHAEAREASK